MNWVDVVIFRHSKEGGWSVVTEGVVHECGCAACRAGDHPERKDHRQLNVLLSRLDEQQRRWVAGREAGRAGMAA